MSCRSPSTRGQDEQRSTDRGEVLPEEAHAAVRPDFIIDTYNIDRLAANYDLDTERYGDATYATAQILFTGSFPFMGSGVSGAIVLVDTAGTTMTLTLNNGTNTSSNGVIGGDGAGTTNAFARRFAEAVNATTGNITASPVDGSSAIITLTQDVAGAAGNRTNTNPSGNTKVSLTNFTGGVDTEPTVNPFQRPFIGPHARLRSVAKEGTNVRDIHRIIQGK